MAMVGVALVLYFLIKVISWTFTTSGIKLPRSKMINAATNQSKCKVKKIK